MKLPGVSKIYLDGVVPSHYYEGRHRVIGETAVPKRAPKSEHTDRFRMRVNGLQSSSSVKRIKTSIFPACGKTKTEEEYNGR
jgi:hypothetical protein